MMNAQGFSNIILATYSLFTHLAYGSGVVADNATALTTEIDRVAIFESTVYSDYFDILATVPFLDGNGNEITEWGLATDAAGTISSTFNSYPILKNDNYEIVVYTLVSFSGLI